MWTKARNNSLLDIRLVTCSQIIWQRLKPKALHFRAKFSSFLSTITILTGTRPISDDCTKEAAAYDDNADKTLPSYATLTANGNKCNYDSDCQFEDKGCTFLLVLRIEFCFCSIFIKLSF